MQRQRLPTALFPDCQTPPEIEETILSAAEARRRLLKKNDDGTSPTDPDLGLENRFASRAPNGMACGSCGRSRETDTARVMASIATTTGGGTDGVGRDEQRRWRPIERSVPRIVAGDVVASWRFLRRLLRWETSTYGQKQASSYGSMSADVVVRRGVTADIAEHLLPSSKRRRITIRSGLVVGPPEQPSASSGELALCLICSF